MNTPIAIVPIPLEELNDMKTKIDKIFNLVNSGNSKENNQLLTPKEVQEVLKIGRTTFDRYVREGTLKTTKISQKKGARIYVERSELDRIIENGLI